MIGKNSYQLREAYSLIKDLQWPFSNQFNKSDFASI
jgi:hypothetical protein